MRVLLVEDEKYIARAVAEVLKKNHYTVDLAHDGEFGLDCALSGIYDIIILDIMLPKIDGFSILKEVRRKGIVTPIILLTARGEIKDKIQGLALGADDYLAKPFHTDELLARLRALGRRNTVLAFDGNLNFGDISLSPHTLLLSKNGKEVKLKLKEAQLMELLIKNKNMIVSKESVIEKIWGYDEDVTDNHVEVYISMLRKKLSQLSSGCVIQTIRGIGYVLKEGRKSS
ncbi:DNA-binding response regulator [Clostridium thermosuccinogenes]|jgi:DNA-binding response OmpR family regulator|uniref:Stage 0 sporulation protein A homolog n=1 Tax=Clostridium thermosuccinogenes TaxID=84032 RepID=A0A2K2F8B2_9CLOT|nr:response regulator transcription factor [Pseudoclostridium thermosuccinogenes]AUS97215.1 DNA-binding response regulator [Pseudoclostridium thermosuccinogenes]PNT95022.1 DNA-binding response regulator [Pseudoclostridium thermosuccinogenes]PNT95722.1 DNA-binding response regulator [Pseudoclostridium thermosuccinogenes]